MQRHWADNQVSATVTFDPNAEGNMVSHALDFFQYQLKGISFLPRHDYGAFPQMPYEAINESQYNQAVSRIRLVADIAVLLRTRSEIVRVTEQQEYTTHKMEDAFCDGDKCYKA
jgi:hypothetical protein